MLESAETQCPYCGETFTTMLDASAGDQEYIEDCMICCQPILFNLYVDPVSGTISFTTRREND